VRADAGGSTRGGDPPGVLSKTMRCLAAMSETAGFTMCGAAAGKVLAARPVTSQAMTSQAMTRQAVTSETMTREAVASEATSREAMTRHAAKAMTAKAMTAKAMEHMQPAQAAHPAKAAWMNAPEASQMTTHGGKAAGVKTATTAAKAAAVKTAKTTTAVKTTKTAATVKPTTPTTKTAASGEGRQICCCKQSADCNACRHYSDTRTHEQILSSTNCGILGNHRHFCRYQRFSRATLCTEKLETSWTKTGHAPKNWGSRPSQIYKQKYIT
jgi:hypothetical protein